MVWQAANLQAAHPLNYHEGMTFSPVAGSWAGEDAFWVRPRVGSFSLEGWFRVLGVGRSLAGSGWTILQAMRVGRLGARRTGQAS